MRKTPILRTFAAVASLGLVVAACGDTETGTETPPPAGDTNVEDTTTQDTTSGIGDDSEAPGPSTEGPHDPAEDADGGDNVDTADGEVNVDETDTDTGNGDTDTDNGDTDTDN